MLTQILARVAVPFFLTVSGYFLLPKAEREGRRAVCPFLRRTLLLYLCATLFYLPLQLYKGHRPGLLGALRGFARLTGLTTLLMYNDFLHFLAVACLSLAAGALFCRFLRPRPSPAPARCWAEIDLSALRHNLGALRARIPPECALMAVVKADGYGHGAVQIARFCAGEGVGAFAVATVNEGATLRRAGIKGDILVLGRTFPPEFSEAHRRNLILTVADPVHAKSLPPLENPSGSMWLWIPECIVWDLPLRRLTRWLRYTGLPACGQKVFSPTFVPRTATHPPTAHLLTVRSTPFSRLRESEGPRDRSGRAPYPGQRRHLLLSGSPLFPCPPRTGTLRGGQLPDFVPYSH